MIGKLVFLAEQSTFSVGPNETTSTTVNSTTTPNDNKDDTLHLIAILVPCIAIAVFISAILASLYCYRKKVLCFSNNKQNKQNDDDNKESYVLSVSKSVDNALNSQHEPQIVYDTFSNEARRLNAAWDEAPESNVRSSINCSINFAEAQMDDTELDFALPTFVNNDPYEEDTATFSPMQGFVTSLLSRYDNEASATSEAVDDGNKSSNDGSFESNEDIKDRGFCIVKTDFNPNTFQYKSTPGLLGITKGEKLLVLQNDSGSGWTCVRNPNTFQTGFVPSRNLKIL